MDNISKYDEYAEILKKGMRGDGILLSIALVIVVGLAVFFIVFIYRSNKHSEWINKELGQESTLKKDNIKLAVGSLVFVVALAIGGFMWYKEYSKYRYDIDNNAYVFVENGFTIEDVKYGHGRGNYKPQHRLTYRQNGKLVEVHVDTDCFYVEEGDYTDCILVYGSKSKVVVDLIELPKDESK